MQYTSQRKPIYNRLRNLLPTTGNVIFTVFMIGITLWAQSAGAFYSAAPATETEATTQDSQNSTIPYQGYLTDDEGQPLDGDYDITFRLYAQSSGGSPIWTEQRTGANKVTLSQGLFTVRLGSVNTVSRSIIVDNDEFYLGVTIGTDSELTPRVQISSEVNPEPSTGTACLSEHKRLTFPGGGYTPLEIPELTLNFSVDQPSKVLIWTKGIMQFNTFGDTGYAVRMDGAGSFNGFYSKRDGTMEQLGVQTLVDVSAGSHTLSVDFYSSAAGDMLIHGLSTHKTCLSYVVLH